MSDFPHRSSSKENTQPFFRICPSYLKKCEYLLEGKKPNIVYKQEIATTNCNSKLAPVMTPRNLKQLRNLRFKSLNFTRISRDALYNLHEIAFDLPNFVWKITIFPDFVDLKSLQMI